MKYFYITTEMYKMDNTEFGNVCCLCCRIFHKDDYTNFIHVTYLSKFRINTVQNLIDVVGKNHPNEILNFQFELLLLGSIDELQISHI